MATPLYAAENAGSRIYKIGRAGLDSGTQDAGGVYTATMRTERLSPAGEDGLTHFRRAVVRIWHTGSFSLTMTAYVDGVQTQIYSGGVLTNQSVTLAKSAPTSPPTESVVEADINASGTFIELQIVVNSDAVTGVFLPETLEVHHDPIRQAKARNASSS